MQSVDRYLQHGNVTHVAVLLESLPQARFDNDVIQLWYSPATLYLPRFSLFQSNGSTTLSMRQYPRRLRPMEVRMRQSRYNGAYAMSPRARSSSRTERTAPTEQPQSLPISLTERVPSTRKRISNSARFPSGLEYASM